MPQVTENITVRMQPNIHKKLEKIAASMDRSRNWLINQAVELYLDLYDWQAEHIKQRLHEAEHGGEFLSHDEVMREMEDKIQARRKP